QFRVGYEFRRGFEMLCQNRREVLLNGGFVARLGETNGLQQKVCDLRHGGDDGHNGPLRRFARDQRGGGFHAGGRAYAGAAEFHYEQIVHVRCCRASDTRPRTISRIFSSTSSAVRTVESR